MNISTLWSRRFLALALGMAVALSSMLLYTPQASAADAQNAQNTQSTGDSSHLSGAPPAAMAFDGLIVRPLSLGATILGTATFIVSLPFSAIGGNVGEAGHALVVEPAEFTFGRPLGQYSDNGSK